MKKLQKLKNTSVRKRIDGRIELRFYHNNKQKSVYGHTEKEVLEKYKNWKPKKNKTIKEQKGKLFNDSFIEWQELFRKNKIKENNFKDELNAFKKYVFPYTKNKKLSSIKTEDMQKAINSMEQVKRRQTTIYNILNKFLNYCVNTNKLKINPLSAIDFKRTNYIKKGTALSINEEKQLTTMWLSNKNRINDIFLLMLSTGMRVGEVIKINGIDDIDRINNTIHIKGTKTKNSNAIIEFPKEIIDMIPKEAKPYEYKVNHLSHRFKKQIRSLKINDNISLKSLRTTFATRCKQNGMPKEVIAYILRHTSTRTTEDFYLKTQKDFVLKNINKNPFNFKR